MKKNLKKILLPLLLLTLLLSSAGCGQALVLKCNNPATDASVKTFYSQKVSAITSIPFNVSIAKTEVLNVPTAKGIGGPKDYRDVPGGQKFTVEITIKAASGSYTVTDYYQDAYTLNSTNNPATSTEHYANAIYLHNMMDKFSQFAKDVGISDCKVMVDNGDTDNDCAVFLYCEDYDAIALLLSKYKNEVLQKQLRNQEYSSYGVYIFTSKQAYDSIDFGKFRSFSTQGAHGRSWGGDVLPFITDKSATRIGSCTGSFDKDLFTTNGQAYASSDSEYKDYTSFNYLVFWAAAEPNTSGDCDVQLFGIK